MKKIILSMFCIFLLVGCSTKQENITIKKNNNQETVDLKVGFGLHHIEDGYSFDGKDVDINYDYEVVGRDANFGLMIFINGIPQMIKHEDKESLVGTEMTVKLIDFSKENLSKIVASRKILLEEAKAKKEAITWDSLQVGDIVKAEIKRFTNFGAFAEVDGVDGLIHLSQISWSHIKSCEEVLKIGQIVDVKIINLDKETKKLSLSIKELTPEPWSVVDEKYSEGSAVLGKVVRINDFGAFVELEPGIDGLVHISKISHDHIKHPSEVLSIGQEVKCIILSIDKENRKIALSIKDAE